MSSRIEELRTTKAQLTAVRAAITEVETNGQSFALDGMAYSRANIDRLYHREKMLISRISRLSGSRPMASSVLFNGGGYATGADS